MLYGSRRLIIALGAILALLVWAPGASAAVGEEPVPWGAGCMPTPEEATRTSANCGAALTGGTAVAPPGAPPVVKRAIAAANEIDNRPYVWGGGHVSFLSHGYDCSGAVSYALAGGGFLSTPLTSGSLESWGAPGPGRWITVYASATHAYAVIAGLRWDTVGDARGTGPRWHVAGTEPPGFVARHPPGY